MDITTVLGSAAVGALVSSGIAELGKLRERKSRREELALTKAAELSHLMYQGFIEQMKMGEGATVRSQTEMISNSYRMFKHLLDHGVLDSHSQEQLDAALEAYAAKKKRET